MVSLFTFTTCFSLSLIGAHAELTLAMYGNSAMHGKPEYTKTIPGLNFSIPLDNAFSAEVTGQIIFDATSFYAFSCSFSQAQVAMVWVDDHLVCNTKPPFGAPPGSTDGSTVYPLMGQQNKAVPLVVHIYNSIPSSKAKLTVDVSWIRLHAPMTVHQAPKPQAIPAAQFLPDLPPLELQRRALQQRVKQGWNIWSYNMLGVVKLPESIHITTALCKISSGQCLTNTRIEDTKANIRVGMFATDLSYWQFFVEFAGLNVSLSYSGGSKLSLLAEPLNCGGDGGVDCSDYMLVLLPGYKWERAGGVAIAADNSSITYTPLGLAPITLKLTSPGCKAALPTTFKSSPLVTWCLGAGAVGLKDFGVGSPTVTDIRGVIDAARTEEVKRLEAFTGDHEGGDLYTTKEGLQAATMWNYIYTPAEYGPILPVSRSWNRVFESISDDWNYVIFDWDNIFASYMTSMDPTSKDIAYSNLIQVIRSRTAKGFVPNYAAGGKKSVDRTEPPIGAKVLQEIYNKYGDVWLVELLFDDLVGWSDWFLHERILKPLGLVALGSDYIQGYNDSNLNTMAAARLESGLDNSPMYDGDFFNESTQLMGLYDVGFSSMFVQEAEALSSLAEVIQRPASVVKALKERAQSMRTLIATNLWDDVGGIFTNKFQNGSFYRRISPTSFYALLAGAATDKQAALMATKWLMSPDHFCIAPSGDFEGNKDTCYWGLPSIQAADPAFPPLGYWRGYVWGPMAQLTYWSLQAYDHVPEVRKGRKALCKQMNKLMLWQWRKNRHICENYSPHRTADDHQGDCSGTKFYHWGALTGMISLIEEGYYNKTEQPVFV